MVAMIRAWIYAIQRYDMGWWGSFVHVDIYRIIDWYSFGGKGEWGVQETICHDWRVARDPLCEEQGQ
jgi:hypothetical protein